MNFLTNLNLNTNELQNARIHVLTTAPTVAKEGQVYYNSVSDKIFVYDGSKWIDLGVKYSQTDSTSSVITGLSDAGVVSTTAVGDLTIGEDKLSDILSGLQDAIDGIDVATDENDGLMSAEDKLKLDGIAAGAEVNVQSDWAETDATSDAFILNKPSVYTKDEIDGKVEDIEDEISDLDGKIDGIGSAVAGGLKFFVVSELPDISALTDEQFAAMTPGTIYLIPKDNGEAPDTKVEYIFIKGEDKEHSSYEQIGELQPSLEDYLKTEDLEDALDGINISDTVVTIPAPTEADVDATEDRDVSEAIAQIMSDIASAQSTADEAQDAAGDAQSAADAAQETADSALEAVQALTPASFIKKATATIAAGQTTATATLTIPEGKSAVVMTVIEKDGSDVVYTDAKINATNVVFEIADAYKNPITCEVFYYIA